MKRRRWLNQFYVRLRSSATLLCALSFAALAEAGPQPYRTDRILIKPKSLEACHHLAQFHAQSRCEVLRCFHELGELQVICLPSGLAVEEAIAQYTRSGLVEFAEPDYWLQVEATPNDLRYSDGTLWALNNTGQDGGRSGADIAAVEGWELVTSAPSVIVAVIDTGVRYTHEDLSANMWVNPKEVAGNGVDDDGNGYIDDVHGINAVANNGDPNDDHGHGTLVAGVIGAVGNNRKGVVGVAWKVQLMACKYSSSSGAGGVSDAIQCIDYARTHGAQIINASWGNALFSAALQSAIQRAQASGIILVAAAGNSSSDNDVKREYPSGYELDNIIAVAATDRADRLWDFSNFGAVTVDLGAPGVGIYSTFNSSDKSYSSATGTSLAAPFVSGALALVRSSFPTESYRQHIHRIFAAAEPLPTLTAKTHTGGRLNLQRALQYRVAANFTASTWDGSPPLEVEFQDVSLGTITQRRWDFGDNTQSTESNPKHTFTKHGTYDVTLTVESIDGTISITNKTLVVVRNYQVTATPFNWIDPSGMNRVRLTDNQVSSSFTLPFRFVYFGQTYDRLYVGSNGVLGFDHQALESPSNRDLPDSSLPNAIVSPYWDDLDPGSGGTVHFGIAGSAPNRKAVISWVAVPPRLTPFSELTFQAVLHETSNAIEFQYLEVHPDMSRGGAKQATIGLENETGRIAAKFAVNSTTSVVTNRQAILFSPQTAGSSPASPIKLLITSSPLAGHLQLLIQGEPAKRYAIESSFNLLDWTPLSTNTADSSGRVRFSQPFTSQTTHRFFRAVQSL